MPSPGQDIDQMVGIFEMMQGFNVGISAVTFCTLLTARCLQLAPSARCPPLANDVFNEVSAGPLSYLEYTVLQWRKANTLQILPPQHTPSDPQQPRQEFVHMFTDQP